MRLVECVPNFSEGRRAEVVDALADAVATTPAVQLLDRTSDVDHNRSVLTFAGPAEAVAVAMEAAVEVAIERIDMERHEGQHPRIGAVDVVPFVPLGESTMDECFGLPVYLYARAATRSERVVLADIRKPQYEGLKTEIGHLGREPDFGPAAMHATAGAMAVGARPFLIAYNINLETSDVDLAKRIAHRIRERSGGLPRVQALGLYLDDLQRAQVSMNLLDHTVTPIWLVWETVRDLAAAEGVALRESELIGLAPLAALVEVADHLAVAPSVPIAERLRIAAEPLAIRDFEPTMALELRLEAATRATAAG
jgi:glutamate formiminotransferase